MLFAEQAWPDSVPLVAADHVDVPAVELGHALVTQPRALLVDAALAASEDR